VFLIDHDQRQLRQRRQDRQPRPEHEPSATCVRREPVAGAFAFGQPAMHRHDGALRQRGETRAESGFELRREIDFRDEHERLRIGARTEQMGQCVEINLGFAAAGHAVQQERGETLCAGDRIDGIGLLCG